MKQLKDLGRRCYPEEACALLIGNDACVSQVIVSENIASEPKRFFEIDPTVRIKAEKQCREDGRAVIGVFHSHPDGDARPSKTDEKMIYEPDLFWLIASVDNANKIEIAAFHPSSDDGFEKAELKIEGK
ncbi:hypothetical protein GUA87_13895 [Sneathiella sp. P13V-1]|nr:hypothetical protein [Sneathiella sp. P13V-1]